MNSTIPISSETSGRCFIFFVHLKKDYFGLAGIYFSVNLDPTSFPSTAVVLQTVVEYC